MSRDSRDVLREKARIVLATDRADDDRALQLYLTISLMTGMDANEVRRRVRALASA